MEIPNLIEVQKSSYREFLQAHRPPSQRKRVGLQEIFMEIFPIQDFTGNLILEFVEYRLGLGRCRNCPELRGIKKRECLYYECNHKEKETAFATIDGITYRIKYDPNECKKRDVTYGISLQLVVRLINKLSGEVKQQEVFLVNLPIMTDRGTFIINGAERVVVSQLHRSPGAYYKYDKIKKQYHAKIIPYRGAWLEYELDVIKDTIHVRIDRKRKQPITILFKALGFSNDQILDMFNNSEYIENTLKLDKTTSNTEALADVYAKLRPGEPFTEENALMLLGMLFFDPRKYDLGTVGRYKIDKKWRLRDRIMGQITCETLFEKLTGEIAVEPGDIIVPELATTIEKVGLNKVRVKTLDGEEIEIYNEREDETIILKDVDGFKNAILGKALAEVIVNAETGEVIYPLDQIITVDIADYVNNSGVEALKVKTSNKSITLIERAQYEVLTQEAEERLMQVLISRTITQDIFHPVSEKKIAAAGAYLDEHLFENIKDAGVEEINVTKGRVLTKADIVASVRYLIDLCNGMGHVDDIDHLGSRRVRRVGELLQNQFRMSLIRMERDIKERMTIQDAQTVTTQSLINARPVAAMIKDFFGSSQLSQFMDQTNPLSELTHKRRVSALGPGGVKRERAGYEIRDVHPTHYGRICPIETPEGPNAGLISSLAIYAVINEMGFIESPLCKVEKSKLSKTIKYMDAYEEDEYKIAPADIDIVKSKIVEKEVSAKFLRNEEHEFSLLPSNLIDFVHISPMQMISVATALIPFLEHDDANRALMGTNMQRQAVPLIRTEAAVVGTGLEHRAAMDSGAMVTANYEGKVVKVDSNHVVVEREKKTYEFALENHTLAEDLKIAGQRNIFLKKGVHITHDLAEEIVAKGFKEVKAITIDGDIVDVRKADFDYSKPQREVYKLLKFSRSNQGTCINQKAIVKPGQMIKKGDVIADGPATSNGQLALGRNVLGVFMPWEGYNYEDAILLSETLVKEDVYTSVHIEEYEIETRDTRLGVEEITMDIPNISSEALKNLDEDGIIRIGAEVESGDILVGKVTPKGETELTAEDKLLRAIFGEKAREVRNTSFVVPHGESGKVVDVMVFSRENKDELPHGVNKLVRVFIAQKRKITEGDKMAGRHGNKGVIARILPEQDMPYLQDGTPVQIVLNPLGVPSRMNLGQVFEMHLGYIGNMLGFECETPVFDGAQEIQVKEGIAVGKIIQHNTLNLYNTKNEKIEYVVRFNEFYKYKDSISEIFINGYAPLKKLKKKTVRVTGMNAVLTYLLESTDGIIYKYEGNNPIGTISSNNNDTESLYKIIEKGNIVKLVEFPESIVNKIGDQIKFMVTYDENEEGELIYDKIEDSSKFPSLEKEMECYHYTKPEFENVKQVLSSISYYACETGKQVLYDGRTGKAFDNMVTVGQIYMLKLAHLVDDKIHARATGPYSLVTQQPLGGKAQFGGQRFGEMEVWALEAYGVSHTLQELLTVKSDDVDGRVEVYEAIIKGENVVKPSVPESFKVLLSELQSLGLKVELMKDDKSIDLSREIETDMNKTIPYSLGNISTSI